ncbi:MAG: UDP-N-acetylmuramoyl-tripeptide--D-alanyl-D-alanine ligase [Thermoanaerobacteraceae bacterium]|nr:UDP-N-acetylmuramoyl-tripeptide--D-alanyl-D-alanine ligase [Thermoanaerobacteraceae bacterium]
MKNMTVAEIAGILKGRLCQGDPEVRVGAVSIDSRRLASGQLFFALRGERHDGHDFIPAAVAAGAGGVVVDRLVTGIDPAVPVIQVANTLVALQELARYNRRAYRVPVIGVTGSSGKTSTKDLVAAALSRRMQVLKTTGNQNNEIGLPLTLLEMDDGHQAAVVEMAMRGPGEIAFLCDLARPTAGIITNIGEAHVERLGSVESIARAKGELLEAIPPEGFALLHRESPFMEREAARCRGRVYFFGFAEQAHVRALDIRPGGGGNRFKVRLPDGSEGDIYLPLPGRHNVLNALAAVGVAWALGVSLEDAARGLAAASLSPMRLEMVEKNGITIINDAYNANPASTGAALQVLAEMGAGRRIAVLGDMLELGREAFPGHRRVGAAVAAGAVDYLVTVGELGRIIATGAVEAGFPPGRVFAAASNTEAVDHLRPRLLPGDVVLVKGSRGMGMEQIVRELLEKVTSSTG